MFIEFSVENYKSFKERVTLSMEGSKIVSKKKQLDENNLFSVSKNLTLLKSTALYGANASGKSNLAKALIFMKRFIQDSSKDSQAKEPIDIESFLLSDETVNQPSSFEIVFLIEGVQYRYGFIVDREHVMEEWLFHMPKGRETRLFERNGLDVKLSRVFKEGKNLIGKTRTNALFLSVVAQFNGEISQKVLNWFWNMNIISGLQDEQYLGYTAHCLTEGKYCDDIIELVKHLDLSISNLQTESFKITPDMLPKNMPDKLKSVLMNEDAKKIVTYHERYDQHDQIIDMQPFDLGDESEGTQKIIALAGPLIDTLKQGKILIIDEFDARLHPLITRQIVQLFHSPETNPLNAQLIVMTHDTNLLDRDLFRRDQIWFTEKGRRGASKLYSLVEYKIRNDASFEKDYIQGRYGAIPFIGDLREIMTK